MSFDTLGDLNWLAVLGAAVAYYALGAIWYARPVLGNIWMESIGWKPDPDSGPQMSTATIVLPVLAFLVRWKLVGDDQVPWSGNPSVTGCHSFGR